MSVKSFLKNTKIVSTFGPAITSSLNLRDPNKSSEELQGKVKEIIFKVIDAGVNCVRYNFSHGFEDENSTRIAMINKVQKDILAWQNGERKYLRAVSMMADTKGPEIRVFDMGPSGVSYTKGQEIVINTIEKVVGSEKGFSVLDVTGKYNMANDCVVGNSILVEDGKLRLNITNVDKENGKVTATVMNNHLLKINKRINLPGASYSMDFLSEKDIKDIKYSIDNGFEYVALSFVNTKDDVWAVKKLIADYCKEKNIPNFMKVYSKMETTQSCSNLDEIVEASDGIMIARGDLGLEVPYYEVPYWTKLLIKKCRAQQKPVITATQMLDSLERNVVATRAEVSDVYRAAELGSDCTMLSGETAQGQFPVLSVETMTNIVYESEKHFNACKFKSQFEENIYVKQSSEVKELIDSLNKVIDSHDKPNAVLINADVVSIEFLKALSSRCLKCPVFVFKHVEKIDTYCSNPDWNSEDYKKMKELSELVLFRSINIVFVEGKVSDVTCDTMFKECFDVYVKDCCPECCVKNMICLETKNNWRFVN